METGTKSGDFKGNIDTNLAEEDDFLNDLYDFANTEKTPTVDRRPECLRCGRPVTVCWCPFLPEERISTETTVYILQHPFEALRKLKTAPMLELSLQEDKCHIIRGKKINGLKRNIKYPDLASVLQAPNTVLLFPGEDAIDIAELPPLNIPYNLVVLDGTWTQAKGMYINNRLLKVPKKVMINNCDRKSKYVIRTQPTDYALSTLECVAVALAVLEDRPQLADTLVAPLVALCDFQINFGAVEHESKEFRIANGLWNKALKKKVIKKLEKERLSQRNDQNTASSADDDGNEDNIDEDGNFVC